jgi:hypothetical protein
VGPGVEGESHVVHRHEEHQETAEKIGG